MNYSQLISRALEITKKYKYLWWLSLLAIIGGVAQEGGGSNFSFNLNSSDFSGTNIAPAEFQNIIEEVLGKFYTYLPILIVVILIALIVKIGLYILGLIAKGGLIDSINLIEQKKKSSFSQAMSSGKKYALKIFLVRLLGGLANIVLGIAAVAIVLMLFFLFFLTIPALIVIFVIVSIIFQIAQILVVTDNKPVIESIKTAWNLFIKKWKEIAVMWLINLGISLGIGLIVVLIMIVLLAITGFLGFALYSAKMSIGIIAAIVAPIAIIIFAAMLFVGSLTTTFFTSYWTMGIKKLMTSK